MLDAVFCPELLEAVTRAGVAGGSGVMTDGTGVDVEVDATGDTCASGVSVVCGFSEVGVATCVLWLGVVRDGEVGVAKESRGACFNCSSQKCIHSVLISLDVVLCPKPCHEMTKYPRPMLIAHLSGEYTMLLNIQKGIIITDLARGLPVDLSNTNIMLTNIEKGNSEGMITISNE